MSARALASASRPPRALIFPLSFELSERPKISICCRDDDRARPHTRAPDRDMRARARRARNLSRIACAVTVAVLARTATASAWEFTGRDVDRPAKRVDGERSWSAPVMAEALRARAVRNAASGRRGTAARATDAQSEACELLRGRARVRVVRRETRVESNAERAHAEEGSGAATRVSSENDGISKR